MSLKLLATAILFLSPLMFSAQSLGQSVKTEGELVSVLCHSGESAQSRAKLLKSHPQLVNPELWAALMKRAASEYYGSAREQSFAIYEIALLVADRMQNPKFLGTTYYNIGRSYSGLNQLSKAVEAYESSRGILEQAGLSRDVTYVLSDLGRLYFILAGC